MSAEVDKTLSPGPEELRCLPSGGAAGHEVWKGQLRTEGETQAGVTLWTHRKDRTWRRLELSVPVSIERANRTQTRRRSLDLENRLGVQVLFGGTKDTEEGGGLKQTQKRGE